jgi:hypothetical protein
MALMRKNDKLQAKLDAALSAVTSTTPLKAILILQ